MKSQLVFSQDTLINCCGVDEVGGFDLIVDYIDFGGDRLRKPGTGMFVSTFTAGQKKEFAAMCDLAKLLYKSPGKRNRGGSIVYVCVFQYKEPKQKNKLPKL